MAAQIDRFAAALREFLAELPHLVDRAAYLTEQDRASPVARSGAQMPASLVGLLA
jgi:hypothetical protein